MPHNTLTAAQRAAIDTRERTLLVSAAAGSGKTFTMTQRIIDVLLSGEADIDQLLVVTFTVDAAAELRRRIGDALKQALQQDPNNARLSRQYLSLSSADILTIDAFCNDLVRKNADMLGLSPAYRVPDTAEVMLLQKSLMDALIDDLYEGRYPEISPETFADMADAFGNTKNDGALGEDLLSLYGDLQSTEEGLDTLRPMVAAYDIPDTAAEDDVPFVRDIVRRANDLAYAYLPMAQRYVALFDTAEEKRLKKYADLFSGVLDLLRPLSRAKTYAACQTALCAMAFASLPKASDEDDDTVQAARTLYASLKLDIGKLSASLFTYLPPQLLPLCRAMHTCLTTIVDVLAIFHRLYAAEKRRLALCEYADMERFAYELLWKEGARTPLADTLRARYRGVYIDEYQDVNRLQDRIFEAVADERNRFMVGDIKQSIYGFRSADPDVFAGIKKAFAPLSPTDDAPCAAVYMSENFRCDRGVIDAVNEVFDRLFAAVGERIGYTPEDRLIFAKAPADADAPAVPCEFLAVETGKEPSQETDEAAALSTAQKEAHAVARRITDLLENAKKNDGTPVGGEDIVILFRTKSRIPVFAEVLSSYGIPCAVGEACDLFVNPDILLTLCLLNAIDNPSKDIYLLGALLSPVFGFSADDAVAIRRHAEGTLYDALLAYADATQDKKAQDAIARLSHYRALAEGMPMDALLYRLYRETGLLALAAAHGGRERLLLLYEYARAFERSSFRGLYAFISYINRLIENKTAYPSVSDTGKDSRAVRLMTIHASKGLEFPVVFVAGCGTDLYHRAPGRVPCIHCVPPYGIALPLPDKEHLCTVKNPFVPLIDDVIKQKALEEELRVFYVAMTRARERLFLSATVGKSYEDFCRGVHLLAGFEDAFRVRRAKTFAELVFMSAKEHIHITRVSAAQNADESAAEIGACPAEATDQPIKGAPEENTAAQTNAVTAAQADNASEEAARDTALLTEDFRRRFSYVYPDIYMTQMPEKLSVSLLSPAVLDGTEDAAVLVSGTLPDHLSPHTQIIGDMTAADTSAAAVSDIDKKRSPLPPFFTGKEKDKSAERGIATHTVLQFCDFDRLCTDGVASEIERLVDCRFLSQDAAALVRREELSAFAASALLSRLRRAKRLYRELRFHVFLPAALFTEEKEKKRALGDKQLLVQGVMDCVAVDADDNLLLIDYKTDRLSPAARADRALAEDELRQKHRMQLSYYAAAVQKIFGRPPDLTAVYSLALGDTVDFCDLSLEPSAVKTDSSR